MPLKANTKGESRTCGISILKFFGEKETDTVGRTSIPFISIKIREEIYINFRFHLKPKNNNEFNVNRQQRSDDYACFLLSPAK